MSTAPNKSYFTIVSLAEQKFLLTRLDKDVEKKTVYEGSTSLENEDFKTKLYVIDYASPPAAKEFDVAHAPSKERTIQAQHIQERGHERSPHNLRNRISKAPDKQSDCHTISISYSQ